MVEAPELRPVLCGAVLCLAIAGLSGSPALASQGQVLAPAAGEVLTADTLYSVRWSGLPADADELELLLTVDDCARHALRLTPRLDPRSGTYLWLVPSLPASSARVRVRWGVGGRELEGPASAPFEIHLAPQQPLASLQFSAGEWWVACRPCFERTLPLPVQGCTLPGPPKPVRLTAAASVRTSALAAPAASSAMTHDLGSAPPQAPSIVSGRRHPAGFPLRR